MGLSPDDKSPALVAWRKPGRLQAPGRADACFDRAWGGVLANLGKRFDQGPQDWSAWLKQLAD